MKIVFFGDSITDMNRSRDNNPVFSLGMGYPYVIANEWMKYFNKEIK